MSAYIQFFLRAGDKFYPIGAYSRSSAVYEMFEEVENIPWAKIVPVTSDMLTRVQREVINSIDGFEQLITKNQNRMNAISKMEGTSLEERMDMYEQYEEVIEDYRKE